MTNPNFTGSRRCIDIVFCVDGTGSMTTCPTVDEPH